MAVNTPEKKQTKPSSKNKKLAYIIGGSVASALVIAIAIVSLVGNNNNSEDALSQNTTSTSSVSSSIKNEEASSISSRENITSDEVQEPQIDEELSQEVEEKRKALNTFQLQNPNSLDVSTLAEEKMDAEVVSQVKKEYADEMPTFKSEAGKQVELTINYSSIGDQDFSEGTLYIKLSEGLSIVPGSIEDNFNGSTVQISDELYNSELNLIKYGPGTGNQETSEVKVGEKGTVTFVVEIEEGVNDLAISSYLKDKDGKTGKPGIIFLEV